MAGVSSAAAQSSVRCRTQGFFRRAAPYLAGLLALLRVAAMQFAFLVVRPLTSAAD
jgi:hypothetical protein